MLRDLVIRVGFRTAVLLLLGGFSAGCIIGTWPQPEGDDSGPVFAGGRGDDNNNGNAAGAGEACDGLDDEGDGTIDEGCPCSTEAPRQCTVKDGASCLAGEQTCDGAEWSDCGSLVETGIPSITEAVMVEVTVSSLRANGAETFTVTATPVPACDGIAPSEVRIEVRSLNPSLTLSVSARDDGTGGDATAGDGRYSASLTNPFGPGVSGTIEVRATVLLDRDEVSGTESIGLEEEP
ncbi:MAG: choice-of-anchor X domain-containing protein [Myxococcota bacterium]